MKRSKLAFGLIVMAAGACQTMGTDEISISHEAILEAEWIFPPEDPPTPACHASTIVETRDGRLLAAWFGGTGEGEADVGIWVSFGENGFWSRPVEVAHGDSSSSKQRFPCWNPVLFQPRQGPLALFFKVGPTPGKWWGEMMVSEDDGATWKDRRRLPPEVMGPIKDKPVQLDDGRILCPSSSEHAGWRVHLEVTRDLRNWETIGPLNDPDTIGAIQPTILTYPDGRLQMLCRTRRSGCIAECWSRDRGRTWSEMTLTSLPNPNSGIDAVSLRDGRQLLVFNNTRKGRTPLNVAISRDGKQWDIKPALESGPGEFSYPAVIQTSDGWVHITYTYLRKSIKHVVLDPREL